MMIGAARLRVAGEVRVLGDKSISHRALLLAALAEGRSTIRGVLRAGDTESTAGVLRSLGIGVPPLSHVVAIAGRGLRGIMQPHGPLDCGNSGTSARLLLGVLAAQPLTCTLTGDASLTGRPMFRVAEPLRAMGARIDTPSGHDGLPLTVCGGDLRSVEWTTPVPSAQIKSAILLAGLCAQVPVVVQEPQFSRDHTERLLASLGVDVGTERLAGGGARIALAPSARLPGFDLTVPGDPSSAAYFAALAALADAGLVVLREIALNPARLGFVGVLRRMGAAIATQESSGSGEPVGDLIVQPRPGLKGTTIEAQEVPSVIDELPLLACVAARAEGETTILGAGELRLKESDRIAAIVANLRAIGVAAEELPDGLRIQGAPGTRLRGNVRTFGDHRIAMAFAVLSAASGGEVAIDDPACVAVSYPDFWRDLERLTSA